MVKKNKWDRNLKKKMCSLERKRAKWSLRLKPKHMLIKRLSSKRLAALTWNLLLYTKGSTPPIKGSAWEWREPLKFLAAGKLHWEIFTSFSIQKLMQLWFTGAGSGTLRCHSCAGFCRHERCKTEGVTDISSTVLESCWVQANCGRVRVSAKMPWEATA